MIKEIDSNIHHPIPNPFGVGDDYYSPGKMEIQGETIESSKDQYLIEDAVTFQKRWGLI